MALRGANALAGIGVHVGNRLQRQNGALLAIARSYTFDALSPGHGGSTHWPRTVVNTGLCVCPQGELMVIERFGKMVDIKSPGLFFIIPVIDRIA